MEEELKSTIQELLKESIQRQLTIPRLSLAFDGSPKPVSQKYSAPLASPRFTSGNLYSSTEVYFESDLDDGEVSLVVDFGDADYWYWVDQGRRPSTQYPNITAIRNWVETKPALNYIGLSVDQRTFLAARSIKEYGYYGINFIDSAVREVQGQLEDRFGEYAREFLDRLIRKDIITKWNQPVEGQTTREAKQMTITLEVQ